MAGIGTSLSSATTAIGALSGLLMVSPQNTVGYAPGSYRAPNPDGSTSFAAAPSPIVFHYEGEQSVTSETDITDHYIEDNTAVQDQIALKPVTISTHGFIGELNNVPNATLALLQTAANKLTVIGAYAPQVSLTAQIAYQEAFFAYQILNNAANSAIAAYSSLSNLATGGSLGGQAVIGSNGIVGGLNTQGQNLQQTWFQQFFYYQQNRVSFTVQTPWAVFQNMYIWKLRPVQDAETNVITDFDITFKMIRTVGSTGTVASATSAAGQLASQSADLTNTGTSTPQDAGAAPIPSQ